MKVKAQKHINFEADIRINSITLLSLDEYKKYSKKIPVIDHYWWLRSPGYYSNYAVLVNLYGAPLGFGDYVTIGCYAVRPALVGDFKGVSEFEFASHTWIVLADNLAICKDYLFSSRFDADNNKYETSEVKARLNEWLKSNIESEE